MKKTLLMVFLISIDIVLLNAIEDLGGLKVAIYGVDQVVPYSTRSSYVAVCTKNNVLPIDECATMFETKTIEKLIRMEAIYTKYLALLHENTVLKQQNTILLAQQQESSKQDAIDTSASNDILTLDDIYANVNKRIDNGIKSIQQ